MEYCFAEFKLDVERRTLKKSGAPTRPPLIRKHVQVLQALIEANGPLSRDEILNAVWPSPEANSNSVDAAISAIRKALGDNPAAQIFIATAPKGYHFVGKLRPCEDNSGLGEPLTNEETEHLDRSYWAFTNHGLDDNAMNLAKQALGRAYQSDRLQAHWAHRLSDTCRTMVILDEASAYASQAWLHVQRALKAAPNDPDLTFMAVVVTFGQIMVDDYLRRGAFSEAHGRHETLLAKADELLAKDVPEPIRTRLKLRKIHIRRQQAEMLRLQGLYGVALSTIREVLTEYPESAYEPRAYARLSEADSLRQVGAVADTRAAYDDLAALGRERNWQSFLAAALWRLSIACQVGGFERERDAAIGEAMDAIEHREESLRHAHVRLLLAMASGVVSRRFRRSSGP